jgi:hypothetical protein
MEKWRLSIRHLHKPETPTLDGASGDRLEYVPLGRDVRVRVRCSRYRKRRKSGLGSYMWSYHVIGAVGAF